MTSGQSGESWVNLLKSARKTALIQDGMNVILYYLPLNHDFNDNSPLKMGPSILRV